MGQRKFWRPARFMSTLRSAGALTVDSGGATITAGNVGITAGGVDLPVETGATGTNLVAYGLSAVTSTAAGTFTLATPTIGVEKFVTLTGAASTNAVIVRASTGGAVTFDGTNFIATFTSSGSVARGLHLMGQTTAQWMLVGSRGTVAYSTS